MCIFFPAISNPAFTFPTVFFALSDTALNAERAVELIEFPIDIDHIWETDELKIDELLKGARKIHILHGHYTPTTAIYNNIDKIDSIVFHNLTKVSLVGQMNKDEYLHWYGNWEWESELINKVKNKIWIGLYNFPYETERLHTIPNYYEFTQNKELSKSTKVGFAARVEGRKNVEYVDDIDSVLFTNSETLDKYYIKKYGYKFQKSRIYKFKHKYKENFYKLDWGISHSYELVPQSCFQSLVLVLVIHELIPTIVGMVYQKVQYRLF